MATDDDTTQPQPAAPAPGSMSGYLNDPTVQALLRQITNPSPPQLPAPPARVSSDGTRPGWLSLLGEGLGGGQSPLYHLSGSAEDAAGSRSLLNFGIGMLMASGPQRVRPGLGQIFGSGLQAAQESMDASQKAAFTQAGQQFQQSKDLASLGLEQQKSKIEQLNAILPLLRLNALQNQPPLYGGGTGTGSQPASPDRAAFTASFTPTAQAISAKTGLPVDFIIAQAGLETGWGTSSAYKNNNAFGISDDNGKPLSYKSPAEGAQAYIDLMNSDRYKNVPRDGTPQQIGDRLALAGYNPNVPKKDSTDSYGARIAAFARPVAAATAAPATAPPAPATPSGVQLGGVPPAPPGGAQGAATGAPAGFGTALNPATPVAKVSGQPRADIEPTTPEGRIAALIGGTKLAQADMAPPGTVQAAGPAAGTPPTAVATRGGGPASYAPPPANLPAGNYNNTPATPAVQPTTPQQPVTPATPATPATPPATRDIKAQGPDGSYTIPDLKLSKPEFQARYRMAPTADELAQRGLNIAMPGYEKQLTDAATAAQAANAAAAQADAQRVAVGLGGGTDASRAIEASINANAKAQEAQQKYADMLQDTGKTNAKALQDFYDKQDLANGTTYDKLGDRAAELERQVQAQGATSTLEKQKGDQAIALEKARVQSASEGKVMDSLNETQESARTGLDQLDLARSLSQASGSPGFWQMVQQSHPDMVRWLGAAGALPDETVKQLGTTGAMDAAFNKLISMARTGSGFQRMTNLDVQILSSQAPEGTSPEAWRDAKMAYLQSYLQRQSDYVDAVHSYAARPNTSIYDAQRLARADMEKSGVVPTFDPTQFHDIPGGLSAADQRKAYALSHFQPNTFYRLPDGTMRIWAPNAPRQQQPQQQPQPTSLVPTN